MKKTLLLSTLTAGLLFSTTILQAKTDTKTLVKQQITQTQKTLKKLLKRLKKHLMQVLLLCKVYNIKK